MFLLEDDDSVTVAAAIAEPDAVVPVAAEYGNIMILIKFNKIYGTQTYFVDLPGQSPARMRL